MSSCCPPSGPTSNPSRPADSSLLFMPYSKVMRTAYWFHCLKVFWVGSVFCVRIGTILVWIPMISYLDYCSSLWIFLLTKTSSPSSLLSPAIQDWPFRDKSQALIHKFPSSGLHEKRAPRRLASSAFSPTFSLCSTIVCDLQFPQDSTLAHSLQCCDCDVMLPVWKVLLVIIFFQIF